MGVDLVNRGRTKKPGRRELKSKNPYLQLLCRLYGFLSRRVNCNMNPVILKRLKMPRRFRAVISISRITKHMTGKEGKTAVIVGSVTDDVRFLDVPKLSVCALRFSETARARILKSGGECLTFDQLALRAPKGKNCILLRGSTKSREAEKHFGRPAGVPHSNTKPYVRSKGKNFEKARGRRKSRGYKA